MTGRFSRHWDVVLRVTTAGAWVFAVGTLLTLVAKAWAHWPGKDSTTNILAVTVEDQTYVGLGFRYPGTPGLVLMIVEAVAVLAAIIMSVVPGNKLRRIGHAALLLWSALWLANAIYVSQYDLTVLRALLIVLLAILFLCTAFRAVRGWSARTPPQPGAAGGHPAP